ncbi:hypothetical protein KSP39_PZI021220 [Platanthera zijinensis]|uniref:Thioredoxin-like protein AAED1, chloroplastic n=1 Tax=Platanthera zijinensis TaxID=2320716 RepID=A0AAP0AYG7_9ASPA
MAMHVYIATTSTGLTPPLIRLRPASATHPRILNHPTNLLFLVHNKESCRLFHLFSPIRSFAGSSGSVSTTTYKDIRKSLDKVEVFDLSGKTVPIIDLWRDRKAVVAFARHFGCVLCRKRADVLASKKDLMDAAGVALVLIAPGTVDQQAITFCEQTKFKGEVYADPTHSSFDALNFSYGVSTTFTPKAGMKIIKSYLEGYRQDWGLSFRENTRSKGGWQQGGILVAGPGISNISYLHKDKEAGDDPDVEDVLEACCS